MGYRQRATRLERATSSLEGCKAWLQPHPESALTDAPPSVYGPDYTMDGESETRQSNHVKDSSGVEGLLINDPDLNLIAERWHVLHAAVRAGILAMVQAPDAISDAFEAEGPPL